MSLQRRFGRRSGARQRGVSLIEALVAFGVMSFGMLAVVGMQATLRGSGDLARQRAEAVRIAQDYIEEWRGFSTLVATPARTAYADIVTMPDTTIAGSNTNYTLKRHVPVVAPIDGITPMQSRTLVVDVEWTDRTGQPQSVRLSTVIAGIEPELAASIVLPTNADPVVSPGGRFRGIPPAAVVLGGGLSGYVPPGQSGSGASIAWVFNNTTGVITLCTTSGSSSADLLVSATAPVCGTNRALLLSGAVRFSSVGYPTTVDLADPAGPYVGFNIGVTQSAPIAQAVSCFQDPPGTNNQVNYYCAVPITPSTPNWSGQIDFTGFPISTLTGASASQYKVCRYFSANTYFSAATSTYSSVNTAALSQNFLIMRAGDGSNAYQCSTSTLPPTWAYRPLS